MGAEMRYFRAISAAVVLHLAGVLAAYGAEQKQSSAPTRIFRLTPPIIHTEKQAISLARLFFDSMEDGYLKVHSADPLSDERFWQKTSRRLTPTGYG
jgi:hypothetical protein